MKHIKNLKKNVLKNNTLKLFKEKAEEIIKLETVQALSAAQNPGTYRFKFKKRNFRGREFRSAASVIAEKAISLKKDEKDKIFSKLKTIKIGESSPENASKSLDVDLKSEKSVAEQLNIPNQFSFMKSSPVTKELVSGIISGSAAPVSHEDSGASSTITVTVPKKINKIDFNLYEVKCIDATDPEKIMWVVQKDEIALGGVTLDSDGEEKKISEFEVGKFKDGTVKEYDYGKTLRTFLPDSDYTDGKTFIVTLFMAEKDSEGFSNFLSDVYSAIKDDLEALLEELGEVAGSYIGAEIGGTVGSDIGGKLGAILAEITMAIITALFTWFSELFKDDVFAPSDENMSVIMLDSEYDDLDGSDKLTDYMYFEDHSGKYRVKYKWELSRS